MKTCRVTLSILLGGFIAPSASQAFHHDRSIREPHTANAFVSWYPYYCSPVFHVPLPTAPDTFGGGYYTVNHRGMVYGPNYNVYPPFAPYQGRLPGKTGRAIEAARRGAYPYGDPIFFPHPSEYPDSPSHPRGPKGKYGGYVYPGHPALQNQPWMHPFSDPEPTPYGPFQPYWGLFPGAPHSSAPPTSLPHQEGANTPNQHLVPTQFLQGPPAESKNPGFRFGFSLGQPGQPNGGVPLPPALAQGVPPQLAVIPNPMMSPGMPNRGFPGGAATGLPNPAFTPPITGLPNPMFTPPITPQPTPGYTPYPIPLPSPSYTPRPVQLPSYGYTPPPDKQPPNCFPFNPYVRSPRDFFMWRENMEDQLTRELRPSLVP